MTASDIIRIKNKITTVLESHTGVSPARALSLLPLKSLTGKLYEADVLSVICENLTTQEKFRVSLVGGGRLTLRQKGGQIDRTYPYFQVWNEKTLFGELFTDIYFLTLSYQLRGTPASRTKGDYHELDIALLKPGQSGYPQHTEVMLAIECKNTLIEKNNIRELLGVRRELSLLQNATPTNFSVWPVDKTPSNPNSVHMLYCSDSKVTQYHQNCLLFGIIVVHHKM